MLPADRAFHDGLLFLNVDEGELVEKELPFTSMAVPLSTPMGCAPEAWVYYTPKA